MTSFDPIFHHLYIYAVDQSQKCLKNYLGQKFELCDCVEKITNMCINQQHEMVSMAAAIRNGD